MTYLLDTHFIVWSVVQPNMLSEKVREILSNPDNRIIVSTVSFWEISLKESIGKLKLTGYIPQDFPDACTQMGFEIKTLSAEDTSTYHHLSAQYHKDPFDRMLIWQAINNGYILISNDKEIKKYTTEGLKVIW